MPEKIELRALPPEEAVAYFAAKGYQLGFDWRDVWHEEHRHAFTVAKAMSIDLLRDIRQAVDTAIAEGITFRDFRQRLEPNLIARGWWGSQDMLDPLTGETRTVQLGSPRRLRIIFDTNLRTAYAAGRWARVQRVKERRPYLRYVAVLDERTRPRHRAWHGTVLDADHGFWQTHFPPNGWRCRCVVQQLGARDLERRGLAVTDPPETPTRAWTNSRTGESIRVPDGIDPGFAFNHGADVRIVEIANRYAEGLAAAPLAVNVPALESLATASVLGPGRREGVEYLAGFDLATGQRFAPSTDKKAAFVSFPPDLLAAIREPGRSISLHHNHPTGSSLSTPDINALVMWPGLREVIAHGHDGTRFRARRGEHISDRITEEARHVGAILRPALRDLIEAGELTPLDASKLFPHMINETLSAAGLIDYDVVWAAEAEERWNRHASWAAPLIAKAREALDAP